MADEILFHRVAVVLAGELLSIEYRDGGESHQVEISPGQVEWEEPTERIHRCRAAAKRRVDNNSGRHSYGGTRVALQKLQGFVVELRDVLVDRGVRTVLENYEFRVADSSLHAICKPSRGCNVVPPECD
jgi:hypothetical protein